MAVSGSAGRFAIIAFTSGGRATPCAFPGVVQPSTTAPTRWGYSIASHWQIRPPIEMP